MDDLVEVSKKLLSQLLADKHIELLNIAPSSIPADILATLALWSSVPLPSSSPASSSQLLYIGKIPIAQPQPARPIFALLLEATKLLPDPFRTPRKTNHPKFATSQPTQEMEVEPAPIPPLNFSLPSQCVAAAQAQIDELWKATKQLNSFLKKNTQPPRLQ